MRLDPRLRLLLWLGEKSGHAFTPDVQVAAMRTAFAEANRMFGLRGRRDVNVRAVRITTSDGSEIGARLYRRARDEGRTLPVLVYFHGGGWVIGDLDGYDGLMRFFTAEGRIAVLSVEYRLAPEHRFPRSHEDAFDAYAWVQRNAARLDLDPARIAVGGDSAGGSLSAAIANYAPERGLNRPAFALLIYPSVDTTARFPSRSAFRGNLPLTPESIDWFTRHAMNDPRECADPLFVPLDAPHPERHPPAYILAARYDPLVDEGRAYFERLRAAGVGAAYDLRATLPHGFLTFARIVPEAERALRTAIGATATALGARGRRVAAITGAGSGIGRALALEFARRGDAVALADRDAVGLAETAALLPDRTMASLHVVDVAQKTAVDRFAAAVVEQHARVDVVINNAGVSLAGDVAELSVDEIAWLMNVNFYGVVHGVKAFLPFLHGSPDATIVNISSVFGLIAPPGQSAYAASKFAVRGFSEALREELRGKVHVVTVHPGGIRTNIARSARVAAGADEAVQRRRAAEFERRMLTGSPDAAARLIMRGIERKRDRVLIGADARLIDVLARVLGPRAARVLAKRSRRRLDSAPPAQAPAAAR